MSTNGKGLTIGSSILAIAGLLALVALVIGIWISHNGSTQECGGGDIGGGANKCYGSIALRASWDIDYDTFYDSVYDYEIAGIDRPGQYVATDKYIYIINSHPRPGSSISSDGKKTYYLHLFQDGQERELEYSSPEDVPTYLVIDYTTHEVRAYRNVAEVPQEEQGYFRELGGE